MSVALVLAAAFRRHWAIYVPVAITLVSGVAQAATLEARRLIVSALEFGAAAVFVAYLART